MSKSRPSRNKKFYEDAAGFNQFDTTKKHRKEKHVARALKLRDVDALIDIEETENDL